MQLSVRGALSSKKEESQDKFSESLDYSDDDEANFDARMRQQILRKRKELGDHPTKQKLHNGNRPHYRIHLVDHLNIPPSRLLKSFFISCNLIINLYFSELEKKLRLHSV